MPGLGNELCQSSASIPREAGDEAKDAKSVPGRCYPAKRGHRNRNNPCLSVVRPTVGACWRGRESQPTRPFLVAASPSFSSFSRKHTCSSFDCSLGVLFHFFRQGEVTADEFWEGLRGLGLGRDLPRSHVSRMIESFKASKRRDTYSSSVGRRYGKASRVATYLMSACSDLLLPSGSRPCRPGGCCRGAVSNVRPQHFFQG